MSGAGRKTPYRKNVTDEVLYGMPEPAEEDEIVQVVKLHGKNILEVPMQQFAKPTKLIMLYCRYCGQLVIILWPCCRRNLSSLFGSGEVSLSPC